MADELPIPQSRTESYLAKAAGEDVSIPEEPQSRLEQYLNAIAENGGGGGGGGGDSSITILTADDYNYTFDGHDCIAAWLLPAGTYKFSDDLSEEEGFQPILLQMHGTPEDDPEEYWAERSTSSEYEPLLIIRNIDYGDWQDITYHCITSDTDTIFINPINEYGNFEHDSVVELSQPFIGATEDEHGTSGLVPFPQMGEQDFFLQGSGQWVPIPPFEGTDGVDEGKSGAVPTPTIDDENKFLCSNGSWETVTAAGGLINAMGNGDTVAMTQLATTKMLYPINTGGTGINYHRLQIGDNATCIHENSVAIGRDSVTTRVGEVNIGGSLVGYAGSNYRVLGGLYDGQTNHDAATVAQGNTLSTSAPTSTTEGVLGQLWTDTTNMHTYQCTAISGNIYIWTQRW